MLPYLQKPTWSHLQKELGSLKKYSIQIQVMYLSIHQKTQKGTHLDQLIIICFKS